MNGVNVSKTAELLIKWPMNKLNLRLIGSAIALHLLFLFSQSYGAIFLPY
jgi:hypothetical protein